MNSVVLQVEQNGGLSKRSSLHPIFSPSLNLREQLYSRTASS